MKIPKYKRIKLVSFFETCIKWYFEKQMPLPSFCQILVDKLCLFLESKKHRSLIQNHLYFVFCNWLAQHLPAYKGIEFFDIDITHKLLKQTQKVDSTSFNNFTQEQFNEYFDNIKKWTAIYIFESDVDTVWKMFQETCN